jgi:hypothetical protein
MPENWQVVAFRDLRLSVRNGFFAPCEEAFWRRKDRAQNHALLIAQSVDSHLNLRPWRRLSLR